MNSALERNILTLFDLTDIKESTDSVGYDGQEYDGWYCINIKPTICLGCGSSVCYVEPVYYHVIIVWEEKDDDKLLKIAARFQASGFEPNIVSYHPYLGNCIPFDEVAELDGGS